VLLELLAPFQCTTSRPPSNFYTSQDYGYTNNPPGGNGLAAWASNGFAPAAAIVLEHTVRPDINGSGKVDDENNGNRVNVGSLCPSRGLPRLTNRRLVLPRQDRRFNRALPRQGRPDDLNAHLVYVAHCFEFLTEGFRIRHSIEHSRTIFNMPAFYSQFSRRSGHIRPFFRYQHDSANFAIGQDLPRLESKSEFPLE
jgi:hypothetical protein